MERISNIFSLKDIRDKYIYIYMSVCGVCVCVCVCVCVTLIGLYILVLFQSKRYHSYFLKFGGYYGAIGALLKTLKPNGDYK